jgi:hypothetical protein
MYTISLIVLPRPSYDIKLKLTSICTILLFPILKVQSNNPEDLKKIIESIATEIKQYDDTGKFWFFSALTTEML